MTASPVGCSLGLTMRRENGLNAWFNRNEPLAARTGSVVQSAHGAGDRWRREAGRRARSRGRLLDSRVRRPRVPRAPFQRTRVPRGAAEPSRRRGRRARARRRFIVEPQLGARGRRGRRGEHRSRPRAGARSAGQGRVPAAARRAPRPTATRPRRSTIPSAPIAPAASTTPLPRSWGPRSASAAATGGRARRRSGRG